MQRGHYGTLLNQDHTADNTAAQAVCSAHEAEVCVIRAGSELKRPVDAAQHAP